MQLVYTGGHAEVVVDEIGVTVQRDVPTDIPDAVAKRLLEQDTWAEATKPAPAKKKAGS